MSFIMRYVFGPTQRIQQIAATFRKDWGDSFMIGLQMRFRNSQTFSDLITFLPKDQIPIFWKCAQNIEKVSCVSWLRDCIGDTIGGD